MSIKQAFVGDSIPVCKAVPCLITNMAFLMRDALRPCNEWGGGGMQCVPYLVPFFSVL